MRKSNLLVAVLLSTLLITSIISVVYAGGTKPVAKPKVTVSYAMNKEFSCYNITANTSDGGKVVYLFIWQRRVSWNWSGEQHKYTFDTPLILQMSKYLPNGTLDCSITYIPLYLVQYNDTDDNGLFDFWTRGHHEFHEEIEDQDIEWEEVADRPYKIYSLAPISHFRRWHAWNWTVSTLKEENVTIGDTPTYEFSWNVSATVPALPWLHEWEYEFGEHRHLLENTTVDVSFGYHIRLLPEDPEVKYDFKFSNITWAKATDLKLAMMSAILYYSKEPPVVHMGAKSFHGFDDTEEIKIPKFTIAENVTEAVKAFVSYTPNATIDGQPFSEVVNTALQPLFLIPTASLAPEGVYVRGTYPGMEGRRTWRHYMAFAHQIGLPHFKEHVSQDPVIGLANLSLQVIPEFPTWATILLTLITITTGVAVLKRRISNKQPH